MSESVQTAAKVSPVALAKVSKRFAATQALADVSIELLPGVIHGLVGENGAGKCFWSSFLVLANPGAAISEAPGFLFDSEGMIWNE